VTDPVSALARAEDIAETVFFPAALDVDTSDTIPKSHLDRLAEEGFYGLAGPPEYGGLAATELAPFARIVETLASGCLATTFVWLQHHGAVRATAASDRPGIREQWTSALCRGDRRAGVVQAALRPGPSSLRAHARADGWVFEGDALWVSGWGLVETLFTAARAEDDTVVWALLDASDGSLSATPQELVAANASRTVAVHFDDVFVPADRVVGVAPLQPTGPDALRVNGALALGVARRCVALLEEAADGGRTGARGAGGGVGNGGGAGGPSASVGIRGGGGPGGGGPGGGGPGGGGPGGGGPGGGGPGGGGPGGGGRSGGVGSAGAGGDFAAGLSTLGAELNAGRDAMDNAEDVAGARAHAADLALRLAATLVVKQGARSILRDQHAQRLMREATFLLVFGTRAPIQQALLSRLMG
jgi:alkylation response protein AidB-like acyl-CoA dehydrogenase